MVDWVHCNNCYRRVAQNLKFHVTECGHILCEKCKIESDRRKCCRVCNSASPIKAISVDMDPCIRKFFLPFERYLEDAVEVYNFQLSNRRALFDHFSAKYLVGKNEYMKLYGENQKLKKEVKLLRAMIKANPGIFSTSTPARSSNVSFGNNTLSSISKESNFTFKSNMNAPGVVRRVLNNQQNSSGYISMDSIRPSPVPIHGRLNTKASLGEIRRQCDAFRHPK